MSKIKILHMIDSLDFKPHDYVPDREAIRMTVSMPGVYIARCS